ITQPQTESAGRVRGCRFCAGTRARALEPDGETPVDRFVHSLQCRLGDPDARLFLLGHRSKADQTMDVSIPGAGNEFHLRLLAGTDRHQGLVGSWAAEFYARLRVPRKFRLDSAKYSGTGGTLVYLLLSLSAQDLPQDLSADEVGARFACITAQADVNFA